MACNVYNKAVEGLFNQEFDVGADTFRIMLLTADYTFDAAHEFFSEVTPGAHSNSSNLTGVTVVDRTFFADDKTFPSVNVGPIAAFIIYKWTGNSTTSRLLFFSDEPSDFPIAANGSDITLDFDDLNGIFTL